MCNTLKIIDITGFFDLFRVFFFLKNMLFTENFTYYG